MKNQFLCSKCGYNQFCCTKEWILKYNRQGWDFTFICVRCRNIIACDREGWCGTKATEEEIEIHTVEEDEMSNLYDCGFTLAQRKKRVVEKWKASKTYLDIDEKGDCVVRTFKSDSTKATKEEDMSKYYPDSVIEAAKADNVRMFGSGATRHTDDKKLDFEGFLSPLALRAYGEYMHSNRIQADGTKRDSDNWQKGIPIEEYMKSLMRHTLDTHAIHRGHTVYDTKDGHVVDIVEALCGDIFNSFGYLHEYLKGENNASA